MLTSEIVAQVRETLQDMDADRYTDERIIRALNLGVLDLRRKRPDYFIGRYHEPTFQAKDLTDEFAVPEIILPAVISYAVGWVEVADDEYTKDGRAAAMLGKFNGDTA